MRNFKKIEIVKVKGYLKILKGEIYIIYQTNDGINFLQKFNVMKIC